MSIANTLDARSVRITMSVIGYLGVNEFYRKVDKVIQSDPTMAYEDALLAVVTKTHNHINVIKETL